MHQHLNYTETAHLFKDIVDKHKEIEYFVETDFHNIKDIVKSVAPAMIYIGFKERLFGYRHSNNQSDKRIHFAIVQRQITKSRNVKTKHQIIDECRLLAIDVITWLRREKLQNRLNGFEPDSIEDGEPIILLDDGFVGWAYSVAINTPINLSFNPDKWNN